MEIPDLPEFGADPNGASLLLMICFSLGLILLMYFFRTVGDLPHRSVEFGPQQRSMVKVCNPFVLELGETSKDLRDILSFNLSILCPCDVVVVWGPIIEALHELILIPGRDVRKMILTDLDQTDLDPLHKDFLQFETKGKHDVALPCPDPVTSEALGNMPRRRYPVVVFVFTQQKCNKDEGAACIDNDDTDDVAQGDEEIDDNAIIGLFTILHIRDSVVTKDSHILAKYVKTAGIPIYSLQALYVPNDNQSQETPGTDLRRPVNPDVRNRRVSNQHRAGNPDNTGDSSTNQAEMAYTSSDTVYSNHDTDVGSCDKTSISRENVSGTNLAECRSCDGDFQMSNERNLKCEYLPRDINTSENRNGHQNLIGNGEDFQEERVDQQSDSNSVCGGSSITHDSLSDAMNGGALSLLPECVVCQTSPAKCALLPCRHNCVCLPCLRLLDKCPMCRGVMESYFFVSSTEGENLDDGEESEDEMIEEIQRQGMAEHFENFFERVNQMVGFT